MATEDSSLIKIVPRVPIVGHNALDTATIILNRGQTWNGSAISGDSTSHLAGSFVFSNKPIAVTISDDAVYIPGTTDNSIGISDSLCVINNPSLSGLGCNYQMNAFSLQGNYNNGCIPQFLQKYKAYIHHNSNCQNNSIHFSGDIWPPADSTQWDFGDPGSGAANYSNLPNPSHIYSNIGTYTVELFVRHNDNRTDTSWQTITIIASPQVALGADRTICLGDSTTFDAGACSGCTYLWKDLGSGLTVGTSQTFKTGLEGTYMVTVTNSNGCSGNDTVQLITTNVPSITNNPLSKSICSGESTNISLASTVPGTNFHWTASLTSGNVTGFNADSGLVINQVLTNLLPTPGIVTYHITPKVGSCSGTTVDFPVTINPGDSVKVSITASANNICAGTQITFTAHPTNPGLTPSYQWKVNGTAVGANLSTYTYIPLNGDGVTCAVNSNATCAVNNPATSAPVTMTVNPNLTVSVSITSSSNPFCAGSSVTFTATRTMVAHHPPTNGKLTALAWLLITRYIPISQITVMLLPAF